MKTIKRILTGITATLLVLYVGICTLLWFKQEKLIFHPHPLPQDFKFAYAGNFTEVTVPAFDGKKLHCLWFKADTSRGLVFYLHGMPVLWIPGEI